uniref:Ubiquitin like 4A n=1 Tax=Rhinolophus ferrumequinum TaxID=59479 RepID=A0A671DV49_RHIFE
APLTASGGGGLFRRAPGAAAGTVGVHARGSGRRGRHAANGEGTPGPRVQPAGSVAGSPPLVRPAHTPLPPPGAGPGRGRGWGGRASRAGEAERAALSGGRGLNRRSHPRPGQVSEDELVSTLKHVVSEKLNVPVRQQRLLFKGKALADGKRLSDYSIGPNSKLNLVVKPLEKVLLEESTAACRLTEAPPPRPPAWQLIAKVLARHFSAADASRVLDQLQRDYERSLSRLTLDDIERLASRFLHPEVTEAVEKGFSK